MGNILGISKITNLMAPVNKSGPTGDTTPACLNKEITTVRGKKGGLMAVSMSAILSMESSMAEESRPGLTPQNTSAISKTPKLTVKVPSA